MSKLSEMNADIQATNQRVLLFTSRGDDILILCQYWNWFTHADNIYESPVFDGSETSLSGDGEYFEHEGSLGGASLIKIPSGNGGGCVSSGPFAK